MMEDFMGDSDGSKGSSIKSQEHPSEEIYDPGSLRVARRLLS